MAINERGRIHAVIKNKPKFMRSGSNAAEALVEGRRPTHLSHDTIKTRQSPPRVEICPGRGVRTAVWRTLRTRMCCSLYKKTLQFDGAGDTRRVACDGGGAEVGPLLRLDGLLHVTPRHIERLPADDNTSRDIRQQNSRTAGAETHLLQYNDDEPLFSRPCCIRAACTADTNERGRMT